jgi:hypothetical protein
MNDIAGHTERGMRRTKKTYIAITKKANPPVKK